MFTPPFSCDACQVILGLALPLILTYSQAVEGIMVGGDCHVHGSELLGRQVRCLLPTLFPYLSSKVQCNQFPSGSEWPLACSCLSTPWGRAGDNKSKPALPALWFLLPAWLHSLAPGHGDNGNNNECRGNNAKLLGQENMSSPNKTNTLMKRLCLVHSNLHFIHL